MEFPEINLFKPIEQIKKIGNWLVTHTIIGELVQEEEDYFDPLLESPDPFERGDWQ